MMMSQPSGKSNNASSDKIIIPTHRECSVCNQLLLRHLFTKKEYLKPPGSTFICQQCRRNQTAQRCKQPTKQNIQQGRRSVLSLPQYENVLSLYIKCSKSFHVPEETQA